MKKTTRNILIAVLAVVSFAIAVVLWMAYACLRPNFDLTENAYIYVRPSTTETELLQQLTAEGHARSLTGWKVLRKLSDFHTRAGRYAIQPDDNFITVFRRLRNGQQTPVRLTIPSVRRLSRLAGTLSEKLMLDSAEVADAFADSTFAASYGYTTTTLPALFIPNTYEVYWTITLDALMQRMQRENDNFWKNEGRDEAAQRLGMTHNEVVTLASIVDEETNATSEKPRVAGLYLNRLRLGMPLQADPTVKFAIGDDTLRRILGSHLRIVSPYNTYLNTGLPPGPIRVASISGIDAVLKPERHDYLYFCAKEDFSGTHNFARTFAEHQQNARRYQRALNERGIR